MKLRIVLAWIAVNIIGGLIAFAIFDAPLLRGFRFAEYRGAIVRYSILAIAMFFAIGALQIVVLCSVDALLRRRGRALRAAIVLPAAIVYALVVPTAGLLLFVHAMLIAVPFFLATGLIFGTWLTATPAAPLTAPAA
ncbi:MAG TPA: hypothetical protein VJ853_11025 [Thermoanaerobaculia bacterium]|nr:hypothetical protein [Thermoanaerobaculia bacterium]